MLKRMDIKVKIALVYSVILIVMGVSVVSFLSLALQSSMKKQPVTDNFVTVTFNATNSGMAKEGKTPDVGSDVAFAVSGNFAPNQYLYITGDQLNKDLSSEIFNRLLRYSAIAVVIISISTFFLGYYASKWLLKPLTSMAKITHQNQLKMPWTPL